MITVIITRADGSILKGEFDTEKQANEWVDNNSLKGKKEVILNTPTRVKGATLIEETEGPMGIKLYKQKLEADYIVEIIKFDKETRENRIASVLHERDIILTKTNWLFVSDVTVEQKHRKYFIEYRNYLREIEKTFGPSDIIKLEEFKHWLRRNYPEEFMDGGRSDRVINKFTKYLD
jgi:hypothetical protein